MAKKFGIVILMLCCLLVLTGCGCEHTWASATCQAPAACTQCGKTEGELGDHNWQPATCTSPAVCTICGQTQGNTLPHEWNQDSCVAVCKNCGTEDPAAAGHTWIDATCEHPKQCSVCSLEEGEPLPHEWLNADCNNPKRCRNCEVQDGSSLGHSLADGSDGVTGLCTRCSRAIEYFKVNNTLHAWTEYEVTVDGSYAYPVTYVLEKLSSQNYRAEHWFKDGVLQNYEAEYGCKLYYANGKVYYFYSYTPENPEAVIRALSNAASRHVSFSQATYSNMNCLNPILNGPGGWIDDLRGYANAAVDAYGKPFAIVHKCSSSWDVPDDPAETWAVACDWMK